MELRTHILHTTALAIAMQVFSGTALAQWSAPGTQATPSAEPHYDTETKSYGLQIVAIDAAAILGGVAAQNGGVLFGAYVLGGPMVHAANGGGAKVLGSLALRAGLPLGGALLGAAATNCDNSDELLCGLGEIAIGALIGVVTATTIDAAVLAKKQTRVERPRTLLRYGGVAANPDVAVNIDGDFTFGLTGSF